MLNFWRFFIIVIDLLFFLISVDAQNIVYHEDSEQVVSREELNEKIKQQERVFYEKPHEVAHEIIQLYELALQYKDTTALLRIFRLMNYVFNVQGEHDEQIKYSLQQIKLAESLRDTSQIIEACLSLSNAYQSLQNREIALRYSLDAQKLAEQIKDDVALGRALLNVSEEYRKTKDFGIANMYAERANEYFQKSKQPYYEALSQLEFGKIALDKDEYDNAQKYFQKTLQLLENLSPYDKARVLICMGKLYRHKSQYAKSHQYLQESLVLAQAIEAKPLLVRVYHELSITNEANGDLAKALSYYKLYKQHHDELVTKTHNIRTNTLQYHYDKTKKEKEIELLSKNQLLNLQIIRNQEREKYWLIIGISLLAAVIIVTGGSYFYRSKQNKMLKSQNEEIQKQKMHIEQQNLLLSQKNAALDKLNEEKDYMLGIAAHDLKSPLKQIIGLVSIIRLENDALTENQKNYLTRIEESCNRLSSLIDKILDLDALRTNTKNLTIQKIDLTQILSALALDFQNI
ncbi:MAG: tetratricopeptide repeat protein, partial [Flammeovirgaceae bacterium]|nr:tetratricopeptide repeat protein [Flammeovirgaceae bacterium]MDW8286952.1 tetratricopeptide repeat protein [Flammeovirgaceae bacterium]